MLARWQHPERGIVLPDEFIGVAEECGLIGDLSMSVMRQAFEEARGWDPQLTLSVNISPSQLKDPWLAQKLLKLLVETGFSRSEGRRVGKEGVLTCRSRGGPDHK